MDIVSIIVTLVVGGVIGWLASIVMRTDAQQGIVLNVVVGIVGAFLGNFLGGLFGMGASLSTFSPYGLLWAFLGAVVLPPIINLAIGTASWWERVLSVVLVSGGCGSL